jgi:hypothetical protein
VARGFSPLDEQLGLLPPGYSPFMIEAMVRLGLRLPYGQVADELSRLFGVSVSADTVNRLVNTAADVQLTIEQRELERLEQEAPPEREGPGLQQVSADGTMVPIRGGTWMETRTIAIGTVQERAGEPHVGELTYFSRCCSAEVFIRQATLPTHERGTRGAGRVVAIMDGAPWLQELIAEQCPDAVRILDFLHAVHYLTLVASAAWGTGSQEATTWLDEWVPQLKTGEPEAVLAAIRALPTPSTEAVTAKRTALRYLGQRLDLIQYATFTAQGLPIGSGIVESAGTLVVAARLKGSGMQWAARNVSPLLALRSRLCSGQWTQTWSGVWQEWCAQVTAERAEKRRARQAERAARQAAQAASPPPAPPKQERPKTIVDGRPTAAHPWKQQPACSAA